MLFTKAKSPFSGKAGKMNPGSRRFNIFINVRILQRVRRNQNNDVEQFLLIFLIRRPRIRSIGFREGRDQGESWRGV